jgi:hypothetical protein
MIDVPPLDVAARLLSAATYDAKWTELCLAAYDEIVWLRKEAKMWRLRATKAESGDKGWTTTDGCSEVRETAP